MKLFYLILFFFLFGESLQAQELVFTPHDAPAIEISRISKKTTSPIPFDTNFELIYELEKEKIYKVHSYEVKIINGRKELDLSMRNGVRVGAGYFKGFDTTKVKGNLLLEMNAIPPNTLIDIAVLKKLDAEQVKSLLEINKFLLEQKSTGNQIMLKGIEATYESFQVKLTPTKTYNNEPPFQKASFDEYRSEVFAKVEANYNTILKHPYANALSVPSLTELNQINQKLYRIQLSDLHLLPVAKMIQSNILDGVIKGMISSNGYDLQPIDEYSFPKRISNLDTLEIRLRQAIDLITRLQSYQQDPLTENFLKAIQVWRDRAQANRKLLADNYSVIVNSMLSHEKLVSEEWLITGNQFNDLVKLSKFVVVPDVGISTLFLFGHEQTKIHPRPFVGVNLYFRPVDKSIPERNFAKPDLWRIMALQIGLTYGELDNKEFSNLFNDFSLMAGPSFRLNRWFRLSVGTVLTKQTDPNPVIATTRTHFGGYFSASLDLDIFSNAGAVKTRIFK